MSAQSDLDRVRIGDLHARELNRFRQGRPRSLAMLDRARAHMPNGLPMSWMATDNDQAVYIDRGDWAWFTDIDGFCYVDFNASDMAMVCRHANPAFVTSIRAQIARSSHIRLLTHASY